MPTYSLGFILSSFGYIGAQSSKFTPQRVFSKPDSIKNNYAAMALHEGLTLLKHLEFILQTDITNFTLSKVDQVALPTDLIPKVFKSSIENFGIPIYPETNLLYDKIENGILKQFTIAENIAHQYANQYVSLAVSPEWWDQTWVCKGLATFLQYGILADAHPGFDAEYLMIQHNIQWAMEKDGNENVKPVVRYAESPEEILEQFDWISYKKGKSYDE